MVGGELFIALEGDNFDGHTFIKAAFDKGAQAAIVSERPDGAAEYLDRLIIVGDTLRALGDLARHWISSLDLKVIGITGTNGKTTTKDLIFEVLSTRFKVAKSVGNFNNLIGLPLSIFSTGEEHEVAVYELGISEPGEMSRLCEIAGPELGLITNISGGHLEGLGSIETVAREKGALFEALPKDGTALVNKDDPAVSEQSSRAECERVTFGTTGDCDITASWNVEDGFPLLKIGDYSGVFRLQVLGDNGARNALAAWAAASSFGIEPDEAGRSFSSYEPPPGRGRVLNFNGIRIIDDSYNANPVSMREAINILKSFSSSRRIAVVGEMLELGDDHERAHEELGEHIGRLSIDYVLAYGPTAELVAASAQSRGLGAGRAFAFSDDKEALSAKLLELAGEGSVVLVKGSRGNRMEDVIELFRLSLTRQST
jgi:UDP-N-acetylmuramoyl-tripeptide--D-alanyl-D-alanine ligase